MSAQIVAHELGHAIGLQHSTSPADLMFGGYRPGTRATCAQPSHGDIVALATLVR
jgi:predicted Zn-dependent protease